ncbi:MAG: HepT-like ribonuclease domain-containing protein [Cyanobium sp.]
MEEGDIQALRDILFNIDRALGFPITSFEAFAETDYLQDALLRCLEVMGEATKRLSACCRASHPEIPWRAMAGLRDVLIHAYDKVDLQEVWQAYRQLTGLRQKIAVILGHDL